MRHLTLLLLLASTGAACGDDGPPPPPARRAFPIEVTAKDIDGNPLPKAPVIVDEKVIGYTGADGRFIAKITERPGTQVSVKMGELDGYRWSNQGVTEVLKLNSTEHPVPLAYEDRAESRRKDYMVWIKIDCDDTMPDNFCGGRSVQLDGQEVTTTNEFGYAHFTIQDTPGTEKTVVIDTPTVNPLTDEVMAIPEDPTYKLQLDLEPQIYVIEEKFTNALARRKPKSSSRRSSTQSHKQSKPKSKSKPKPQKNPDVIELF